MPEKKHIILDTDIGGDIDDHWALGMLLNIPEAEIELVLTSSGDTRYRTKVAAKFLQDVGRADVRLGIGIARLDQHLQETFSADVKQYLLDDYPGVVVEDGIAEMIRIIESKPEIILIGIGPMTNLAALCLRRPDLMKKCRLTIMAGSIAKNYKDRPGIVSEYNIAADIPASKVVFSANWKEFTITPLDHCGNMTIDGELYQQLFHSHQAIPKTILDCYKKWLIFHKSSEHYETESSILYDTVAIHLAFTDKYVIFDDMNLVVDDVGFLRKESWGKSIRVALTWSNIGQYKAELVEILTKTRNIF